MMMPSNLTCPLFRWCSTLTSSEIHLTGVFEAQFPLDDGGTVELDGSFNAESTGLECK